MNVLHLNRRVHLYLGLVLLPWFLMYGMSSYAFNHGAELEARDKAKGIPLWTTLQDRSYEIAVPAEGDLRTVGEQIIRDTGLKGAFGTYRQSPDQINVYVYTFRTSWQAKYFLGAKRLTVEQRRFRWDHFLTGMHAKGGFEQGGLHNLWGVVVDVVCLGMLLWVVTGLVMWWKLPQTRAWGWVALLGGISVFGYFIWRL